MVLVLGISILNLIYICFVVSNMEFANEMDTTSFYCQLFSYA
jgi:hypothetical protein